MSFEVMNPTRIIPCHVDYGAAGDTLYVGQIVYATGDGVAPLGQAAGAADTTNKKVPFGVVVGTDNKNPLYDSTYGVQYVTSVQSQADQLGRDWLGVEGPLGKADPAAKVHIALIEPTTVLKGRIFNGSWGTALTVQTVTTGSATGAGYTANACDFTPVADLCTAYCRSGANRGIYRITTDASATDCTVSLYFPYDIAVGDTFVRAPVRPFGKSYVQFDSESMFIDGSASPATNYFVIHVIGLDLSRAGGEYVLFRFDGDHFCTTRA
jgi:hypothetical protein